MCTRIVIFRALAVATAASLIGCARTEPSPGGEPTPDLATLVETRQSEDQAARAETAAFTARMQQSFDNESRDAGWAAEFEKELASSYARDRTVPKGALKQVECRTSRCVLDFSVKSARAPAEAHTAILAWLSGSQPCGFYLEDTALETLQDSRFDQRVYVDCER